MTQNMIKSMMSICDDWLSIIDDVESIEPSVPISPMKPMEPVATKPAHVVNMSLTDIAMSYAASFAWVSDIPPIDRKKKKEQTQTQTQTQTRAQLDKKIYFRRWYLANREAVKLRSRENTRLRKGSVAQSARIGEAEQQAQT